MTKKLFFILLTLISVLYIFIRFWQLPQKLDFRLDQAFFLMEAKSTIESSSPRLLGPPTSKIFEGRSFFVGSNYYYLLGVVGRIFSWDPLLVTAFFIVLEFIFYLFFIFFIRQKIGATHALATYLFIAMSPYFIAHSRFYWNPHMLIPLAIITLICLSKYQESKKNIFLIAASFCWGLAFSCHYSPIFWLPFFIYFLYHAKKLFSPIAWLFVATFVVVGDLPFFIFEIRHQFYNLQTFIFVYTHSSDGGGLTSHYFVFPLFIFITYFIAKFFRHFYFVILFVVTILQYYLYPGLPSFGAITGWDYPTQQKIADSISQNCPSNFNIAATMQGDTRFYDLRFLLQKNGCIPDSVDAYPSSKTLFLVSPHDHTPQSETVWEVTSMSPFSVTSTTRINDSLDLHRLDRR